jgi:hypothetical protein
MAPTRFGGIMDAKPPEERKTLAKRKAEADVVYYRELEEIAFKVQLGLLGEDLLDSLPEIDDTDNDVDYGDGTDTETEDLLAPIAAAVTAATVVAASGCPPRNGRGRMTAYGRPTWREIAPEPYVPRGSKSRGRVPEKQLLPEKGVKRICMDLTEEQEIYYEGPDWPAGWKWDAEFIVEPNNGWAEVIEIN